MIYFENYTQHIYFAHKTCKFVNLGTISQDVNNTGPEALPVSVFKHYIKAGIKYTQQNI